MTAGRCRGSPAFRGPVRRVSVRRRSVHLPLRCPPRHSGTSATHRGSTPRRRGLPAPNRARTAVRRIPRSRRDEGGGPRSRGAQIAPDGSDGPDGPDELDGRREGARRTGGARCFRPKVGGARGSSAKQWTRRRSQRTAGPRRPGRGASRQRPTGFAAAQGRDRTPRPPDPPRPAARRSGGPANRWRLVLVGVLAVLTLLVVIQTAGQSDTPSAPVAAEVAAEGVLQFGLDRVFVQAGPRHRHRAHVRVRGDGRGALHHAQLVRALEQAQVVQQMRRARRIRAAAARPACICARTRLTQPISLRSNSASRPKW